MPGNVTANKTEINGPKNCFGNRPKKSACNIGLHVNPKITENFKEDFTWIAIPKFANSNALQQKNLQRVAEK